MGTGRRQGLVEDLGMRVIGREDARNDRHHHEQAENDRPGERLAVMAQRRADKPQGAGLRANLVGPSRRLVGDESNIQAHRTP